MPLSFNETVRRAKDYASGYAGGYNEGFSQALSKHGALLEVAMAVVVLHIGYSLVARAAGDRVPERLHNVADTAFVAAEWGFIALLFAQQYFPVLKGA